MPLYKATIIFNQGRNGWKESYFANAASRKAATTSVIAVAQARQACCGIGCTIDGVSVKYPLAGGSSQLIGIAPVKNIASESSSPWTAMLISMRAAVATSPGNLLPAALNLNPVVLDDTGSVYRRNYLLRGFPSQETTGTPQTQQPEEPLLGQLNAYFTALVTASAMMSVNVKSVGAVAIATASASADPPPRTTFTVLCTTSGNHGLVAGQQISLSGFLYSWKVLNGIRRVSLAAGLNTFQIVVPKLTLPLGVFFPPAYVQPQVRSFAPLSAITILRTGAHDTGKASFVTSGRRKKRQINY